MRHLLFSLLALTPLISFGQTPEKMTQNIIMRGGVFYPTHSVVGKSYYGGEWYEATEPATGPDAFWNISMEEIATNYGYNSPSDFARDQGYYLAGSEDVPQLLNWLGGYSSLEEMALAWGYYDRNSGTPDYDLLASWWGYGSVEELAAASGYFAEDGITGDPQAFAVSQGYPNIEALTRDYGAIAGAEPDTAGLLSSYGYNTVEDWARSYGLVQGDPDAMLAAYGGDTISLARTYGVNNPNPPLTNAQKGSFLDAIENGSLTTGQLESLAQMYNQNGGYYLFQDENGKVDTAFASALLGKAKDPYAVGTIYQNLAHASVQDAESIPTIDFSGWDTAGAVIPNHFPVAQSNLTWDQINAANTLSYVDFRGTDVSNLNVAGKALNGANFIGTNLTGSQVNQMGNAINDIKVSNTNLSGFTGSGKNIYNIDFSNTTGVTGSSLAGAANLSNVNLGATNMAGFTTSSNTILWNVNFSQTANFNAAALNSASSVTNSNFSGKNMTGYTPTNKSLYGNNLSNTNITTTQLVSASNIQNINLTGTGITKTQLNAALVAAGKNPNSGNYNTSTIRFQ